MTIITSNGCSILLGQTVKEVLLQTKTIFYSEQGPLVAQTVAEELKNEFMPNSSVQIVTGREQSDKTKGEFRILLADPGSGSMPPKPPEQGDWMYFRLDKTGNGELIASKPFLIYTLYGQIRDEWSENDVSDFRDGKYLRTRFSWMTGRDDPLTGRTGFFKHRNQRINIDDIESGMRELARLGVSHVVVNELATPFGYEDGPDGEIYYRFYDYLPDLDQYVETKLNRGTYPREYLEGNLASLKLQAGLAEKYGLTPGMHIANPRSVPEELLERYPFLRGARVDHTFRSYRPRYTLTLAHPAVRWHYAELMRTLLREVPQLGFVITLINDSGSGFEYTASLYPGRNGGPYIVKEWLPDDVIARAAAENIIRYYRDLRNAAHEINKDFRIITGLKNIAEESEIIMAGMDNGIDLRMRSQRSDVSKEHWKEQIQSFRAKGSDFYSVASARGSSYVLGVPSPWQTLKRMDRAFKDGYNRIDLELDPYFWVPKSINREVARAFQTGTDRNMDELVKEIAVRWTGPEQSSALLEIWRLADQAIAEVPIHPLYGGEGFTWYRLWVRPLVPDINAIPEPEREYYEKYILSIFNNPNNIDFATDMLWTLESTAESDSVIKRFDGKVWQPLDEAISIAAKAVRESRQPASTKNLFADLRDRLIAFRCYCKTLRNVSAWISGVHGYLRSNDEAEKQSRLNLVKDLVADEIQNIRILLQLWETTSVDFMRVTDFGETMHDYGDNFGELLKRKIDLMQRYGQMTPRIDPDYMWRMPSGSDLKLDDYRNFLDHK